MIRQLLTGTAMVGCLILVSPILADEKKEAQVKEVTTQFLKAVKEKDVEGVMKVAHVPWIERDKTISDEKELKEHITKQLDGVKPERVPDKIAKIETWTDFRKANVKEDGEEKAKKLDEVLGKEGYIISVEIEGKTEPIIMVTIKDGKAKIVGIMKG